MNRIKFTDLIDIDPRTTLDSGKEYAFLDMANIRPFTRTPTYVTKPYNKQGSVFQEKDVLVARITPCLEKGKTVFVNNIKTKYGFGSTEFLVLRPKTKDIDNLYLYYHSCSPYLRDLLIKSMIGASGRQRAQKGVLKDYFPNFPPFPIQKKIASILSAYDDLIELNEQRIKILEEMAQAIYNEWFVKFRFPGHSKVKIVDSELGKIPEGWQASKIGDTVEFVKGRKAFNTNYFR